jgi:glutamate N-acetyltransferase/amino-acid N-acetyltransferase
VAVRVRGFRAAGITCGIKPSGRPDLALIVSDRPCQAAAVFTRNQVPGAPVIVSRARVRGTVRGIVANSGISNVAMGARGLRDARRMTELAARAVGCRPAELLVASTGVIGQPLPMERIERGIALAARALSPAGFPRAARAILTTDTRSKLASARIGPARLLGIAKGAAMMMPDLATMLVFLVTDLAVERELLQETLREVSARTFNRLTIDGETSTSDTVALLANGAAGGRPLGRTSVRRRDLERALGAVCAELCEKLAADGEGVSRLAWIRVSGAPSERAADRVARRIANSPLVKTALFGGDPNWGRIVQAAGAAGVRLRPGALSVAIDGVRLLDRGRPVADRRALARAARAMRGRCVGIEVGLGLGRAEARVLTTDLTYEYVRLNAEYTT